MVGSKLITLFLVLSVAVVGIRADAGIVDGGVDPDGLEDPAPLKRELELLHSKIATLELSIAEGESQLKGRDESILLLEKIIKEKTETVASLKDQIDSLQRKGAANVAQQLGKAHARAAEFEKQVEDLKIDIHAQHQKHSALESRAVKAEGKVKEMSSKIENLQNDNEEQKRKVKKMERALKLAEAELAKVRLEASSRKKELKEIEGAWLPPWLAGRLIHYQAVSSVYWNKHGKPAYDGLAQKISEISSNAQTKIRPHLEYAKTKWVPIIEEQWANAKSSVDHYAQSAVDMYETSLKPHLHKARDAADPYLQETRKFTKPYIDRAAVLAGPHVEKARVILKPYTKKSIRIYRKSLKTAAMYHRQIQAGVKDVLRRQEFTRALATEELVWFIASASLALPIFFAIQILASVFRRKPRRRPQAHQTHRRPKRRHADK